MKKALGFQMVVVIAPAIFIFLGPFEARASPAYAHDPMIIKEGAFYYLFSTGQGIPVSRSRDLKNWEPREPVFNVTPAWAREGVPGFAGAMWAPDISFHSRRYFLYYSVSTFGSNRSIIGLATNSTLDQSRPEYKWVDEGAVIESVPGRDDWNAIDPNLAIDGNGQWFLTFGSFWTGIKLVTLDPATGKLPPSPSKPIPLARRPLVKDDPIEAPFICQHGGRFYLFVSFDYCCRGTRSDYKVAVGRAAQLAGPYVDESGTEMLEGGGTIILRGYDDVHGPGHCSVLRVDGEDNLVHHMYDGRRGGVPVLQVRPIRWTEDGWPQIGDPLGG
jgi:arabinan endo-1,5-alpha-L-arabinosidase